METKSETNSSPPESASASASGSSLALCASCDRCRSRKTKCDGERPCGNCAAKYMKKNKLSSIEGIDISCFECVYSPAKRRGPVPGRASQSRKHSALEPSPPQAGSKMQFAAGGTSSLSAHQLTNSNVLGLNGLTSGAGAASSAASGLVDGSHLYGSEQTGMLHQLEKQQLSEYLMKSNPGNPFSGANEAIDDPVVLMAQQRQLMLQAQSQLNGFNLGGFGSVGDVSGIGLFGTAGAVGGSLGSGGLYGANGSSAGDLGANQQQLFQSQQQQFQRNQSIDTSSSQTHLQNQQSQSGSMDGPAVQRVKLDTNGVMTKATPKYVTMYSSLLSLSDTDGNLLRSYYAMSLNELFCLPTIPTNEEYCAKLAIPITPSQLPRSDLAALQAARFSEIALGAQANNQVSLALELSNATVLCLRECVEEPVHPSCMYDVARAYFLHGVLRSLRGDFDRYFKYRRICMTHLKQLNNTPGVDYLFAAMAFHDSWAYTMFNAAEESLPDISGSFPPLETCDQDSSMSKYGLESDPASIASNPRNKMWIQGVPPVFINNDAPPLCRSLDALACAIRSCCDQANARFEGMADQSEQASSAKESGTTSGQFSVDTYKDEFCSRNMVISAHTLLQAHEVTTKSAKKNYGHRLVISAMEAFLENGEEEADGFTDSQVQSILSVCNATIERPLLLHLGGPSYHIISNAAILLCHLLNGMHANFSNERIVCSEMEKALYDEILDTFISIRKLLNIHRRKLPAKLRCHSIPRPNFARENGKNEPLIDLGETLMCTCRGCQGFVLMGCSPCVAAERAQRSQMNSEFAMARENNGDAITSSNDDLLELGEDSEIDEALLSVLAQLIST